MGRFTLRQNSKKRLPSRGKLTFLAILLIVCGAIWLGAKTIKGPAVGEVYRPSQGAPVDTQTYIEQEGEYVVFNYPEEYKKDAPGKPQSSILEYFTYQKSGGKRPGYSTLAVSVYKITSKLEEDGAFRIRKEQTNNYQSRLSSVNNRPFTIFKKKDGSEVTAFTQNKDLVATISMSGSLATNNQSEAEFTAILNSWQWK